MFPRYIIVLILLCVSLRAAAQHPPVFEGMTSDTAFFTLGDLEVNLVKYRYKEPNINFLAIHDNEDTGVKAAFLYLSVHGGTLVDCQYGGIRNFKFINDEETFQTDPNSIYTRRGIKIGLQKYGLWDDNVMDLLDSAGKKIISFYNQEKPGYIFTLHNNSDGAFGIRSYLPGYELSSVADSVFINFEMDPDDMVLVTETAIFNLLKAENINVVLQSKYASDDGSLSIYAMQNKIPYINVEVQHGHLEENLRLIKLSAAALTKAYPSTGTGTKKE
jgi:hypothetical protein